ncbi:MAG: serine O-acetyltransferase, partial [Gammaproteobacteria bacterium]
MIETLRFIQQKDPASVSKFEIIFCYPGFQAVLLYRLSHWLYQYKIPALPLLFAYLARFITGIEIHPGATIGKNFFIDHGMGVVIGATSVIKDNVHIYHGVTLGATRSIK